MNFKIDDEDKISICALDLTKDETEQLVKFVIDRFLGGNIWIPIILLTTTVGFVLGALAALIWAT